MHNFATTSLQKVKIVALYWSFFCSKSKIIAEESEKCGKLTSIIIITLGLMRLTKHRNDYTGQLAAVNQK